MKIEDVDLNLRDEWDAVLYVIQDDYEFVPGINSLLMTNEEVSNLLD